MPDKIIPGDYGLSKFSIYPYDNAPKVDMRYMVHSFHIIESMDNASVRGNATVLDSANILEGLPLRGEERLVIEYTDPFGERHTDNMFIYSITDIEPNTQGTALFYKIHFVSAGKMNSEKKRVAKSFKNVKISDMVKSIFDEHYSESGKELILEETDGLHTITIPNSTPEDAIQFLARRAYSEDHKSQTFRFYETRDSYYFATLEYIEKNTDSDAILTYTYNPEANYDGEALLKMMNTLIEFKSGTRVNTLTDIRESSYRKNIVELDIINLSFKTKDYSYMEEFPKYFDMIEGSETKHTSDFDEEWFSESAEPIVIVRDYGTNSTEPGLRNDLKYSEIISHKNSVFSNLKRNSYYLVVYGRNDLKAGQIIDLNLTENIYDILNKKYNRHMSGRYFVESIDNSFHENEYTQKLVINRLGWGKHDVWV